MATGGSKYIMFLSTRYWYLEVGIGKVSEVIHRREESSVTPGSAFLGSLEWDQKWERGHTRRFSIVLGKRLGDWICKSKRGEGLQSAYVLHCQETERLLFHSWS